MNIENLINDYINEKYEYADAESKVAQDIILLLLSDSKYSRNITIKGGVVMHNISHDKRRATRDLDLDFIKYSLDDSSIKNFIDELNKNNKNLTLNIVGKIKELKQQDYHGKRVYIEIRDLYNNIIRTKIDFGVHKLFEIEQDEYYFDINNNKFTLLINSMEQIFTEKLKSLLKMGIRSTRYKDLFDFYYLIKYSNLDKDKLLNCIDLIIFKDESMKEKNVADIYNRLNKIYNSEKYLINLENPKVNWLDISTTIAITNVLDYILKL